MVEKRKPETDDINVRLKKRPKEDTTERQGLVDTAQPVATIKLVYMY